MAFLGAACAGGGNGDGVGGSQASVAPSPPDTAAISSLDPGDGSTRAAAPADTALGTVADLAGRVWRVVGVAEGDVVQSPPPGLEVTLQLDGRRLSGSAGCNTYAADVVAEGDSLRVDAISLTKRACVDAADWVPFLEALSRATSVDAVGDGYVIHATFDGAIVLQ